MAHEISLNGLGQSEAVFGFGEKPWWATGTLQATVLDGAISFNEVFCHAFPWTAEMEQLQYADGSLSSQHGIRRSDTKAELGVHSGSYGSIQPRDLFDFCAAFFQAYPEVPIASALAMQGGAVLNLSARLGEIDVLGSGDIHKSYLCFVNSFNGRVKAQVYKSYVRPVCMNTTISGISGADFSMEYKHTKNVRERIARDIDKAAQLMMAQQATDDRVKTVLETLAKRRLNKDSYTAILDDLFGKSDATRTQNIKKEVTALFAYNDNNVFPEWKQTAYALFNAVTNYADHERTVQVTKAKRHMSESQIRFESSIVGEGAELKQRALERILLLSDGSEEIEYGGGMSLPPRDVTPSYKSVYDADKGASAYTDDMDGLGTQVYQVSVPETTPEPSNDAMPHTASIQSPEETATLFTNAPKEMDSFIATETNACVARHGSKVWRSVSVKNDDTGIAYQTEIYAKSDYVVFTESQWLKFQG